MLTDQEVAWLKHYLEEERTDREQLRRELKKTQANLRSLYSHLGDIDPDDEKAVALVKEAAGNAELRVLLTAAEAERDRALADAAEGRRLVREWDAAMAAAGADGWNEHEDDASFRHEVAMVEWADK